MTGRHPNSDSDLDTEDVRETSAIFRDLIEVVRTPPKPRKANSSLVEWVRRYLGSEDRRESGRVITPLLRMPVVWQVPVLEAICGLGVYAAYQPSLRIVLRNVSDEEVKLRVGTRLIPIVHMESMAFVDSGSTPRRKSVFQKLACGSDVELSAPWATIALRMRCREAWGAQYRESSAAIPQVSTIIEVGYRANVNGEDVASIPSKAKKKAAEAA